MDMLRKSSIESYLIVLGLGLAIAGISDVCLQCLCNVESKCNMNEGCDAEGRFCGPFHIYNDYWIDCGKPGKDFQNCTADYECSKQCVMKYMQRYGGVTCPDTCESYARMHNGGPYGCNSNHTDTYWQRMMDVNCTQTS